MQPHPYPYHAHTAMVQPAAASHATLSFKQTEALLKRLGNGRIGFDHKKYALADLRRFVDAWIAQGAFTADYVAACTAEVLQATAVPPAPAVAPAAPVAVPPAPIAAPMAPPAPAGHGWEALPAAPVPSFPAAQPVAPTIAPVPAQPMAPVATAPVVAAPAPAPIPPATIPAPAQPSAPVSSFDATVAQPHRTAAAGPVLRSVRELFSDQPDVAAVLPADLRVQYYGHPDAPMCDPLYVFDPLNVLAALCAASCTPPLPFWCGGPRGTGKTEFARQLAARLGRAFFRVNFNKATEPAEVMGDIGLVEGATQWADGPVALALRTAGAVLMLDELTYATPGNVAVLNPVLEAGGAAVRLPRTGEALTPAPDVLILAADNTFGYGDTSGEYAARNVIGTDTLDRFRLKLRFDYLPEDKETEVLRGHVLRACGRKMKQRTAGHVVKLMRVAREKSSRGELNGAPSLRGAVAFAVSLSCGMPAPMAYEVAIVRNSPDESHEELRQIFAAHWPADAADDAAFTLPAGV